MFAIVGTGIVYTVEFNHTQLSRNKTSSLRTNSSPIFFNGVLQRGQTFSSSERSRYLRVIGIPLKRSASVVLALRFLLRIQQVNLRVSQLRWQPDPVPFPLH